ncbi:MAG TPA: PIN domain-containing protein, partial [Terriglobales bacterium]|nr:PIN domain-containing protein [Terriglobales bacterium]
MKALLDTHILLWWIARDPRLTAAQKRALRSASADHPLWVSEITLWEIATLFDLGRIELDLPLRDWLE